MDIVADFARRGLRFAGLLGCGAFGDTYAVLDQSGTCFVVKRSKSLVKQSGFLEEYLGMMNLCSLHVVTSYDAWIDHKSRVCILMEYCDAGDLREYLEKGYPLPEEEVLCIVVQLLLGLDHIHKRNRVHRDIKPENIFLSSARASGGRWPVAKLGDFGSMKRLSRCGTRVVSCVGTPLYLAPEIIAGYAYTSKADIWSMGLVVYRLMVNNFPFRSTSVDTHTRYVQELSPPHPSTLSDYSRTLGDCVMAMLCRNWKRRPNAQALLCCDLFQATLLQHLWVPAPLRVSPCLFLHFSSSPLVVYAASSERAKTLRTIEFGDQVYLSSRDHTHEDAWLEVVYPFAGFIRNTGKGELLFGSYASDECTTNIGSLNRVLDRAGKHMRRDISSQAGRKR
ncbi:protein kinase, putative [Leishmania tarentolae]|uniref:non-specific serine/threonine protein kinase n=1 Tax=Leishmania tarentolae TaxID=5689 RepID=A0A640KMK6_LEITA|nr:protein kinase, putative [Leishmania tarentolae]